MRGNEISREFWKILAIISVALLTDSFVGMGIFSKSFISSIFSGFMFLQNWSMYLSSHLGDCFLSVLMGFFCFGRVIVRVAESWLCPSLKIGSTSKISKLVSFSKTGAVASI